MTVPQLADVLRKVTLRRRVIQDFSPLAASMEWLLAELYWSVMGLQPFVKNEVPYLVNNTGRASSDAARLLFANCESHNPTGAVHVLEIGAGTGLFARFFLDAFRDLCQRESRGYYDRLSYIVSDRSQRTVDQWKERQLFAAHADRVQPRVVDGTDLAGLPADGGLRAVIANYVLDVMPASVIRFGAAGAEELQIRTYLSDDADALGDLTAEKVRELAASHAPEQRSRLIDIVPALEFETKFVPLGEDAPPFARELKKFAQPDERVVLNYGAIQCLRDLLARLAEDGFILINDYGPTRREEMSESATAQRFGISLATGLNFPFLDWLFRDWGFCVAAPDHDPQRQIHARMISKRQLPQSEATFLQVYGKDAYEYFQQPIDEAARHVQAGRYEEALESYATAVERNPLDWYLVGQIAELVGLHLRSFEVALAFCREALELNPSLSAWLWNVYGDCLYCLEQFEPAHEAYERAVQIDPEDVRARLNRAFTDMHAGRYDEGLHSVSEGLARDRTGLYRTQLLEKQHEILNALSRRWSAEQERIMARARAFL